MTDPKVLVLLSTYNGERHLEETLDSLLHQRDVEIKILVRDDGSTDGTKKILQRFSNQVNLMEKDSNNVGINESFKLLVSASLLYPCDYIAFCDQDDLWMPDKIIRAVQQLRLNNKSHYASKRFCFRVDIGSATEFPRGRVTPSLTSGIFENVSAGCTTVVSREHMLRVVDMGLARIDGSYDHLIYLASVALDESYFDQEAHIYYRLHESNAIGIPKKRKRHIRDIYVEMHSKIRLFEALFPALRSEMKPSDVDFCLDLFKRRNLLERVLWCIRMPKLRHNTIDDSVLKVLLIVKGTGL